MARQAALTSTALGLCVLGLCAMTAALIHAFSAGVWAIDLPALLANPIALATLIDVYVGLLFVAMWIAFREPCGWTATAWVISLLFVGNLAVALYVLKVTRQSKGDMTRFFLGEQTCGER